MVDLKVAEKHLLIGDCPKCGRRTFVVYEHERMGKICFPKPKSCIIFYPYGKPITQQTKGNYTISAFYKAMNRLEKRKLTKTLYRGNKENRRFVGLTFLGLMVYLQNSSDRFEDKNKLEKALEHYSELLPFSSSWLNLCEILGAKKCLEQLRNTVENFVSFEEKLCKLGSLGRQFVTYVQMPSIFDLFEEQQKPKVLLKKDAKLTEFLGSSEAIDLRRSYIAHLLIQDFNDSVVKGYNKKIKDHIEELESERELALLENREIKDNPIMFNRLKEFFPKYASLEYVFTGMFVKNLLWN
jgi:hypothetical protein